MPEPAASPDAATPSGLVASVRKELEMADRVETFHGQLAMQLAGRLADRDESGVSSLSKELRTVMAAALEGTSAQFGDGAIPLPEPDDEVAKAREARERLARDAAAGA